MEQTEVAAGDVFRIWGGVPEPALPVPFAAHSAHTSGVIGFMILGLLRGGGRLHGYALWRAYEQRSGQRIHSGKFYRTLKSLAEARRIRLSTLPGADHPRRLYELTPIGAQAFDDWVLAFDAGRHASADEISARAPFVFELPAPVAASFLGVAGHALGARLKRLEHERERVLSRPGLGDRDRTIAAALLARNLAHAAADLEWLSEMRSSFTRGLAKPRDTADAVPGGKRVTGKARRYPRAVRPPAQRKKGGK
jgi:DNA-binding PadR family transcriptional regulator